MRLTTDASLRAGGPVRSFFRDQAGSSGFAYALILASIAVVALLAVNKLELSLSGSFASAREGLGAERASSAGAGLTAASARITTSRSLDVTAPEITRLDPPAAGSYTPGQALLFVLTANEAVTVNGKPSLPLSLGARDVAAPFHEQSRPDQLVFRYVIQPEDRGAGAVHLTTLSINQTGGVIQDSAGNKLLPGLPGTADLSGISIIDDCQTRSACP